MKKKKKEKKPKKIKLPKLKREAWRLWSLIVRFKGVCEKCGAKYKEINNNGHPTILHSHHVVGRENYSLSWDVLNGVSLCMFCHKYSRIGPHRGGIIFSDWYMKKFPDNYTYLLNHYQDSVELTIEYMQNIIENLKEELNNLNIGVKNE